MERPLVIVKTPGAVTGPGSVYDPGCTWAPAVETFNLPRTLPTPRWSAPRHVVAGVFDDDQRGDVVGQQNQGELLIGHSPSTKFAMTVPVPAMTHPVNCRWRH